MSKNNPSILIIGTGNLRNYGCEAIVQGTYNILRRCIPGCNISVASVDKEYDRGVLPDDVELVGYLNRFSPHRIFRGILRRFLHIGNGSPVRMKTGIGKKYDIVLSCGGDNYCERPDYGVYDLLEDLMTVGEKAVKKGRKYVLWGASVGPFHNADIEKRVAGNLSLTSGIFLRETLSEKYLSNFHQLSGKLHVTADPAFQMPVSDYKFIKEKDRIYVGINFSGLAVGHTSDQHGFSVHEAERILADVLDSFLDRNPEVDLVFVPHVVLDESQNDLCFLQPIKTLSIFPERIHVLPSELGAVRTKTLIKQLDLLIAARMHCCVAGISTGTPTLFVTYSNKGVGMCNYAYGDQKYALSCSEILTTPVSLVETAEKMLHDRQEIRDYLSNQHTRFFADSMKSGKILNSIIT